MTERMMPRVRKSWHTLRRRLGVGLAKPQRLMITKAKWLNGVRSPVMVMIDDLTNAWHNSRGGETWESGGDWGGGLRRNGSALQFLEDRLLHDFPDVKVTFFTVAGPISAYTRQQPFSHAAPLDENDASARFFGSLARDPRFELAYHGFNHGTPGARSDCFVQEWRGFPSVEAAVAQTRAGLEIFSRATGVVPSGGKYGGWEYNDFAEAALNQCGFFWWCRDWTPRDVTGTVPDAYYEPQFFGSNLIVALPSTVHGHYWDRRQIDILLRHRQVIAVTEHISGIRPDGLTQTPNIVDDIGELRRLFHYLDGQDVWHATGSEIASYVVARERTIVYDVTGDGFSLKYDGRVTTPRLTLQVDSSAICTPAEPLVDIILPDGAGADAAGCRFDRERYQHLVTVPVIEGRYRVVPRAEGGRHAA